jgi:hypothetical protein
MNTDELKAEVEAMIEQLAPPVDWGNPKNLSPLGVGLAYKMAATKLLMKPENQMAVLQGMQRKWLEMWGL